MGGELGGRIKILDADGIWLFSGLFYVAAIRPKSPLFRGYCSSGRTGQPEQKKRNEGIWSSNEER